MGRHVLSILVKNHAGVLSRITGLFTRRGYNIDSLSVGVTEDPTISRITIVVTGDEYIVDQITKQVSKLVEVIGITELEEESSVYRELMLVKVSTTRETRAEILEIITIFRARVIDVADTSLIIEATGNMSKQNALLHMLEPFHIKEIVRTGFAALSRGSNKLNEKTEESAD